MKHDLRPLSAVIALAAAAALSACASNAEQSPATQATSDAAGAELANGAVRIASVDRSTLQTDGSVRYVLDNASNEDQEHLTARVVFYYPPTGTGSIALPFDTDVTDEIGVLLFKGQRGYELRATSRAFADRKAKGDQVLATRLDVQVEELIPTTARDGGVGGTRLLNGQLECVGIASEDLRNGLDGAAPEFWVEIENVAGRAIGNVEARAVFIDGVRGVRTGETKWSKVPRLEPGSRVKVPFDLSGAGEVRNRPFVIQVRQGSGLFG